MKLSIFKDTKAHPKGKDEKRVEASKARYPETVTVKDDEDLIKLVTSYAWSPFVFDGYRDAGSFISCDFLTYDIDEGMTIDEADKLISEAGYTCLCLPSPSHTPEAHRFRLVLPLATTITDPEIYRATWLDGAKYLGVVDEQCKDLARFMFGSTQDDGFWYEGELITPVRPEPVPEKLAYRPSADTLVNVTGDKAELVAQLYGGPRTKVSEAVMYFIDNAHTGIPRAWTNTISKAAFSLSLSKVDENVIMQLFEELAPEPLSESDLFQINKGIKDGEKKRND